MRYPVEGSTIAELESAHASRRATPISDLRPDLPAGVVQVIERALDPDPRRPRSAGAMQQELLATIAPAPSPGHSDGSVPAAIRLVADLTSTPPHGIGLATLPAAAGAGSGTRWLKIAAAAVLVGVFAVPMAWSYRDRLGRSMTGMLLPDKKIVVVLPFRVIGANKEEGLYSEGVSVVLTSNLAQLGLPDQVMPSTEVRGANRYRRKGAGRIRCDARAVGCGPVFRRPGASFIFLIRTADRRNSSAAPERSPQAIRFALQDVVTRDVLTMLDLDCHRNAAGTPAGLRHARRQAFFLYTQARGAMQNYHEQENVDAAIRFLTEAVARDPQYAIAHAALGRASWENFSTLKQAIWLDRAGEACETSASLSPQLSEAQHCLGLVEEPGEWKAIESYRRAIDYSPANDDAHRALGSVLDKLERVDEAEAAYLRAIELPRLLGRLRAYRAVLQPAQRLPEGRRLLRKGADALA